MAKVFHDEHARKSPISASCKSTRSRQVDLVLTGSTRVYSVAWLALSILHGCCRRRCSSTRDHRPCASWCRRIGIRPTFPWVSWPGRSLPAQCRGILRTLFPSYRPGQVTTGQADAFPGNEAIIIARRLLYMMEIFSVSVSFDKPG